MGENDDVVLTVMEVVAVPPNQLDMVTVNVYDVPVASADDGTAMYVLVASSAG